MLKKNQGESEVITEGQTEPQKDDVEEGAEKECQTEETVREAVFGPWMLVTKQTRRRITNVKRVDTVNTNQRGRVAQQSANRTTQKNNTRFDVLSDMVEQEEVPVINQGNVIVSRLVLQEITNKREKNVSREGGAIKGGQKTRATESGLGQKQIFNRRTVTMEAGLTKNAKAPVTSGLMSTDKREQIRGPDRVGVIGNTPSGTKDLIVAKKPPDKMVPETREKMRGSEMVVEQEESGDLAHMECDLDGDMAIVVYDKPQMYHRGELWSNLDNIEKFGGSMNGSRPDMQFRDCIERNLLIDLGYSGAGYTWKRGMVAARLDRALANESWRIKFPEASIFRLPPLKSDHSPIFVRMRTAANNQSNGDIPFRFLVSWLLHEEFLNVVYNAWSSGARWNEAVNKFHVDTLKRMTTEFFAKLYTVETDVNLTQATRGSFPHIPNDSLIACSKIFNLEEIREAVFSMGPLKAPGRMGISNTWDKVQDGFVWRIGKGNTTRFLSDKWLLDGKALKDVAFGPRNTNDLEAKVNEYVTASGGWDWQKIDHLLLDDVCLKLSSTVPPNSSQCEDKIAWRFSKDAGAGRGSGVELDMEMAWFRAGFMKSLGDCSILSAELWGMACDLEVAWELGFRRIILEADSLLAVTMLKQQVEGDHPCANLVLKILSLIEKDWEVKISHIFREGNRVADNIASRAFHIGAGIKTFQEQDEVLAELIHEDLHSLGMLRHIVV
ncbi:hypothetical protein G2W53_021597 [Senna tora]|uniref:RNase H type-1 domain-containing protein n=1 Tax=Senna tora TaxID=362788 RepID=A0A834TJS9_9FABA|nr:hypothetical protein G2W53_021597 [Senna tora]